MRKYLPRLEVFGRNKNKLSINKINGSHNIDFYLLRIEKTFENNLFPVFNY